MGFAETNARLVEALFLVNLLCPSGPIFEVYL